MDNFLLAIILLLGMVAVAHLLRLNELAAQIQGHREENIPHRDNVLNSRLFLLFMVVYYASFIWLLYRYGNGGLGTSASEHGQEIDWLMNFNWIIIIVVFFLTNSLLFFFAFRYYHRPGTKAAWFPHSNKLELLWTAVPACVLAVIITFGLVTWNDITGNKMAEKNIQHIEVYAKQFDFTARYAGNDNVLGESSFRMINTTYNPLGVVVPDLVLRRMNELRAEVAALAIGLYRDSRSREILDHLNANALSDEHVNYLDTVTRHMRALDKLDDYTFYIILSEKRRLEMMEKAERLQRHILKLNMLHAAVTEKQGKAALDDILARELHLVKGQEYLLHFRSQDVIHSAYFPHFRAQMNVVPGMKTQFRLKPVITTDEMRAEKKNPAFDYVLFCNKICGAAHYNMQMKVVVHASQKELDEWLAVQKNLRNMFYPAENGGEISPAPAADTSSGVQTPVVE